MTYVYQWNGFPEIVSVSCPKCKGAANFIPAIYIHIPYKKDISYFQTSPYFEYYTYHDSYGCRRHAAAFFPGLSVNNSDLIPDLPTGYPLSDWQKHRSIDVRDSTPIGSIICNRCYSRTKHLLNWPIDATYQITHKNKILWAYNRDAAISLMGFILSTDRIFRNYRYAIMLRHVPKIFLAKNNRFQIYKKLKKLLSSV